MEAFLVRPHHVKKADRQRGSWPFNKAGSERHVKEAFVFYTVISETNSIHFHSQDSFPPSDQSVNRIRTARPMGLASELGQMQKPDLVPLMSFTARNSRELVLEV